MTSRNIRNLRKERCNSCSENRNTLFHYLSPAEKELLKKNHICTHYPKGELLFKEGDRAMNIFCLSEGKIKIFKERSGGREQILQLKTPVSLVGFQALFNNGFYTESASALEKVVVCTIEKETLTQLIHTNRFFAFEMTKLLTNENTFLSQRLVNLTQKHIRGRIAESLLYLKDISGFQNDNLTLDIQLSRLDLANLSSMTSWNAIRIISNFANEGIIGIEGKKLKIFDQERLEKISLSG